MAATVTRWWWVRHAPVSGHGGRIYGQEDYPADLSDTATFAALATLLPADPVWVTSHLRRTRDTAAAIFAARAGNGMPDSLIEPDIAEQHVGAWHGLTHDDLNALRGVTQDDFALWPASERPPEGESFLDVMARVGPAVTRLTAAHRGRDIVAIAHGGSIRAALAIALGTAGDELCHRQLLARTARPHFGWSWRGAGAHLLAYRRGQLAREARYFSSRACLRHRTLLGDW